jgi:hypothetical protein
MVSIQSLEGSPAAASLVPTAKANPSGAGSSAPAPTAPATGDTLEISSAGRAAQQQAMTAPTQHGAPAGSGSASAGTATQATSSSAVQLAEDTSAQLAQLAAAGNTAARNLLAQRQAAQKLLG